MTNNHRNDPARKGLSDLLTVSEAADVLNVSTSLIYLLVDTRKLACHRIGAKRGTIRIRKEDIEEFLAQCRKERA